MGLDIFTLIHILISLAGILAGLIVLGGWMAGQHFPRWTAIFLAATVATSATGFCFPQLKLTPAVAVGVLSLILLTPALYALYVRRLAGSWRKIYLGTALVTLYLNFFVLVAQLFQKVPALKALAPNQTEPAFGASQALVLVAFIALGVTAFRKFHISR